MMFRLQPRFRMPLAFLTLLLVFPAGLSAESVTVVNKTGHVLDLIQAAPSGESRWGDDLIPDTVILDGESAVLDLIGRAPWAFRFLDSDGEVYVLYEAEPSRTGKIVIGPEHLARLALFAGAERQIHITNMTGSAVSSLRISAVSEGVWGDDVLSGRYIRDGEAATVLIRALPGALSFDIRFILLSGNREIPYEKTSVILTDGASLVLSVR